MKLKNAIKIINCIAKEQNRDLDENDGKANIFRDVNTYDALNLAVKVMKKELRRKESRKNKPSRTGEKWTGNEEVRLCNVFDMCKANNLSDKQIISKLANSHERSYGAIATRLKRLKKLPVDFST